MNIAEIRQKYPQYSDVSDGELVRGLHKKFYADMPYGSFLKNIDFREKSANVADEQSFGQNVAAGAGKALVDVGRGARQLLPGDNPELQAKVDEESALSKDLMRSGGGLTGNIGAHIGMAVLPGGALVRAGNLARSPALVEAGRAILAPGFTPRGVALGAGVGAAQGALPAVATGESRLQNMALGGLGGGIIPAVGLGAGMARAALQPLHAGGREQIVGNALRSAVGANADDVAARMEASAMGPSMTGAQPTAAEVADSGGIAAMQRAASASDPEAYATRATQNEQARIGALERLAGTHGEREFHAAARATAADDLYTEAYRRGVDIRRDPTSGQFLTKAEIAGRKGEINKLLQRPAIQDAVKKARELAANEGVNMRNPAGSVQGLDYVKRALDDMIRGAEGNEARVLANLKSRLLTTVDALSPRYAEARTTFQQMSRPITQMDIAQNIRDRSVNPLRESINRGTFARALSDDTAQTVTGMRNATLANTMEPGQMNQLNAIMNELRGVENAMNLGRGAGSDTVQKLAMSNLMNRAGLPVSIAEVAGVNRLGKFIYGESDRQMMNQLAQIMLDPAQAARVMRAARGNPQALAAIERARRIAAPIALGVGASDTQ